MEKRLQNIEAALGIGYHVRDSENAGSDHAATATSPETGTTTSTASISNTTTAKLNTGGGDIHARVDSLCRSIDRHMTLSTVASDIQKSNALAHTLSPSGLLLTSSTSGKDGANVNASAYVYRRQEILARYEDFHYALEQLANIRDLLLISNPSLAKELQSKKGRNDADGDENGRGGGDVTSTTVNVNVSSRISMDHVASAPILSSPSFAFAADSNNIQRLEALANEVVDINDRSTALSQRVDTMVDRYYSLVSAINERLVLMQELREEKETD